jgi:hypothetical protein
MLLLPISWFILSCSEDETFTATPVISFKSLDKYTASSGSDSLLLTFSFTDGDGDIGSAPDDAMRRDVFVTLFEKNNGVFEEASLGAPLSYRIPFLEPRGNNKSLKGDIKIVTDYNILRPNDTIFYKLYLEDRAGNKSNVITTSTIITRIQ